ncbi:hypothetical protein [Mesorhizobium sp. ORS 3428]|uniref:hypothetical protein n=1 Tax=Mesorhizobium sp. ORS 3428 TaxID=540997 RepID=UPI0008D92504|nr:hypothetical protein [Mesorhizobium sp. ORS 3428]OHV86510.1 hypothetical protein ORS3428_23920 [Mesorhizobium sp. ORS 3428]
MHVRDETPIAPTGLSRGEALSVLSAGIAGPCCGEATEMLAWLYLLGSGELTSSETAEPPVERPGLWLRLRSLFG